MALDGLTTAPTVVQVIAGGATYGISVYLGIRDREKFDPINFGTTILLSIVVGVVFWQLGIDLNYDNFVFIFVTYAGVIVVIESMIKALWRGQYDRAHEHGRAALEKLFYTTISLGTSQDQIRESIEEGGQKYEKMDKTEQREEWNDVYPEEEAFYLVDDNGENITDEQ